MSKSIKKFAVAMMLLAVGIMQVIPVQAAFVTTPELLHQQNFANIQNQRHDLTTQLINYGVDPTIAAERVSKLSESEVYRLNGQIQSLPAGGDVLGIFFLIFLVFVITDVIGATDIFTFIKPVR